MRRGFTIVELLVVVTIIAILMSITLQVVGGLLEQAKVSATQATIAKLQALVNQRAQGLDRLIQRKSFITNVADAEVAAIKLDYPAIPKTSQLVVAKKMLETKYFPQLTTDLYDRGLYPAALLSAKPTEIFCYFLTQTSVSDTPIGTDAFSSAEIRDVDANNFPEFIDAWGTPLRFYRWPTRFFRSGGQNGQHTVATISQMDITNARSLFSTLPIFTGNLANDLARDPHDPLQSCLVDLSNFETTAIQMYVLPINQKQPQFTPIRMHTPATYHVYMIVSAGPDKIFGMYDPADIANFGYLGAVQDQQALSDDIISLNIKAGGK